MEKLLHAVFPVEKYRCRQCYAVRWSLNSPIFAPIRYMLSMVLFAFFGLTAMLVI